MDSRKALNSRCINDEIATDISFIEDFVEGKESVTEVVRFVSTIAKVVNDNMNYCGYREVFEDVAEFCTGVADCSVTTLLVNVTSKYVEIFSGLTNLATIFLQFPPPTNEDMYLVMMDVGLNIGRFVRYIFRYYY